MKSKNKIPSLVPLQPAKVVTELVCRITSEKPLSENDIDTIKEYATETVCNSIDEAGVEEAEFLTQVQIRKEQVAARYKVPVDKKHFPGSPKRSVVHTASSRLDGAANKKQTIEFFLESTVYRYGPPTCVFEVFSMPFNKTQAVTKYRGPSYVLARKAFRIACGIKK